MKRTLLVYILAVGFGALATAAAGGQQTGNIKTPITTPVVGKSYNPAITYPGEYKADLLFFKGAGSNIWRRIPRFERLSSVTCSEALTYLKHGGRWKGNLDLKDGSCSTPEEPADWAMGNWLNYNDQLIKQQQQSE